MGETVELEYLFKRLEELGYSRERSLKALPAWWGPEVASTPGGLAETRIYLARAFGVHPRELRPLRGDEMYKLPKAGNTKETMLIATPGEQQDVVKTNFSVQWGDEDFYEAFEKIANKAGWKVRWVPQVFMCGTRYKQMLKEKKWYCAVLEKLPPNEVPRSTTKASRIKQMLERQAKAREE